MNRRLVILGSVGVVLLGLGWLFRPNVPSLVRQVQQVVTPQPSVRFAVVGDHHGVNPVYRQIIDDIKGENFDFLLDLADTSEEGKIEEFQAIKELESALPYPVYHTVGSHDIKTDSSRQSFIQVFGHAPWYSIDVEQLHLIVLDNADRKVGFVAEELHWLEKDLAANRDRVNIVAYHRPFGLPLATLLGDDETAVSTASNERLQSIIQSANVRQIFSSHLHTYLPYTLGGIPAVVTGGGGDPAQLVLGGSKNNYFHYLDVTVTGSDVRITPVKVIVQSTTAE